MSAHDTDIQPLLEGDRRSQDSTPGSPAGHAGDDALQGDEYEDEADDQTTAGWFLMLLTGASGISGLLFGYEYVTQLHILHRTY
jgi:hypothetical protein